MKIRISIPAMLLSAISLIHTGCAAEKTVLDPTIDGGHHANLVLPTDSMVDVAAAGDSAGWEFSRNDGPIGGQELPRDTSYRVVETRQWEVLGTINGRPRDYSYTRIRSYSREAR